MTSSDCKTWVIAEGRKIPYGHPPRSFAGKIRKVCNTILTSWAYRCPLNGLRVLFHRMRGCHIGKGVYIGRYCFLDNMYPEYIYIYDGASVNAECMLLTHFNPYETWKGVFNAEVKPVVIGQDAIVAVRCTIMPGVRVGKHAVVSSGMTIEKSLDEMVALLKEALAYGKRTNGRQRILELGLSNEQVAQKLVHIYNQILKNKRKIKKNYK